MSTIQFEPSFNFQGHVVTCFYTQQGHGDSVSFVVFVCVFCTKGTFLLYLSANRSSQVVETL